MSDSEIFSFLEVNTLRAYALLKAEVQKLAENGITEFDQLANITEEDLDRWGIIPLVKHTLAEENKIRMLPAPEPTQTQPPLQEALDMILPQVKASVQQILDKFKKDVEEVIDRKLSEFEKSFVLEVNVRPKKDKVLPIFVSTAGNGLAASPDCHEK